jgi:hypothetical protein
MAMTAILDLDVLRTHAVSVIAAMGLGEAPESHQPPTTAAPRPRLVMRWQVGPDGRPTCHWETDIAAEFGLPP